MSCINEDPSQSEVEDSEMVTVNFCIPKKGPTFGIGSTRAGAYDEGDVSNLYIVAVQTSYFNYLPEGDNTQGPDVVEHSSGKYIEQYMSGIRNRVIIFPLNVYDFDSTLDQYNDYKLTLYPGRYRFYAVANCDMYTGGIYNATGSYTEEEILRAVMNFTSDNPLRVAHLPMACVPKKMKYGNNYPTEPADESKSGINPGDSEEVIAAKLDAHNYTIPIYKSNTDIIYADMEFLCSKVRYTILFDATQASTYIDETTGETITIPEGISVGFGNQSIRFYVDDSSETNPSVTNIREKSAVFTEDISKILSEKDDPYSFIKSLDENATWRLSFNRYVWPESGEKYPRYAADPLELWDASLGLDDWKNRRQKAWQGVVYLPENDDKREENPVAHTEMRFPYVLDWFKEASEYGDVYVDGTYDPNDYKTITLFGGNGNETHYYGGSSEQDLYGDQKIPMEPSYDSYEHGLMRGKFYDVVARVVNPDEWDLEIIVYGQIKDWHETDQNVEESGDIIKDSNEPTSQTMDAELNINSWNHNGFTNKW